MAAKIWKSYKSGLYVRIDLKIDTEVQTMVKIMYEKFCGGIFTIFSFSGRMLWSAYGKSLRIAIIGFQKNENQIKIGFNSRINLKIDT